jgi:hypothetical protein
VEEGVNSGQSHPADLKLWAVIHPRMGQDQLVSPRLFTQIPSLFHGFLQFGTPCPYWLRLTFFAVLYAVPAPIEVMLSPAAVFALFHFSESWILANLGLAGQAEGSGDWNAACYVHTDYSTASDSLNFEAQRPRRGLLLQGVESRVRGEHGGGHCSTFRYRSATPEHRAWNRNSISH